jgi:cell division protein ZapA
MSNVDLSIGGKSFRVACAPGEEQHVAGLGRLIDGKIASMDGIAGQSEARMLLFASLLLADELHELKNRGGSAASSVPDPAIAEKLEAVAIALEKCASGLEGTA